MNIESQVSPGAGRRGSRGASRRRWMPGTAIAMLVAVVLGLGALSQTEDSASAAAPPVDQCNNDTASNVGGQGISCTVVIHNYVTSTGAQEPGTPSTVTKTVCVGAAGPIGGGSGTCTTTPSTSVEPVTLVRQCNGSGNGGGGVVICHVEVTNHFSSAPDIAAAPATVYQCEGSEIVGPGAPAICDPLTTPGVTSVTAATVGQCNGSGNGGTSVGFECTVNAGATMTATLPVHVDQCNGSGNGGGSLVNCTTSVTNEVGPPDATPTSAPGESTPVPGATDVPEGTEAPPAGTGTPASPSATPGSGQPTPGPGQPTPGFGVTPTPGPPAVGNAALAEGSGNPVLIAWLGLGLATVGAATALAVAGRRAPRRVD